MERLSLLLLFTACLACSPQPDNLRYDSALQEGANAGGEWRHYLGDSDFSHASALQQINTDNVHQLQEAWRYDAGGALTGGISQMQCNPLVVRGILYCTSPELAVFA